MNLNETNEEIEMSIEAINSLSNVEQGGNEIRIDERNEAAVNTIESVFICSFPNCSFSTKHKRSLGRHMNCHAHKGKSK